MTCLNCVANSLMKQILLRDDLESSLVWKGKRDMTNFRYSLLCCFNQPPVSTSPALPYQFKHKNNTVYGVILIAWLIKSETKITPTVGGLTQVFQHKPKWRNSQNDSQNRTRLYWVVFTLNQVEVIMFFVKALLEGQ